MKKKEAANKVRLAYAGHGGITALGWWGWWGFGGYAGLLAEIYAVDRKLKLFPDFTYHFEIDGYSYEKYAASRDPALKKGLRLLREMVRTGRVEVVGGTYAGPFAPLCDSESVVRHFEYGLAAMKKVLGFRPTTYYSQEPNYTLQSPRVFREFGYRDVLLRFEYNAHLPKFDAEKIAWRGLDGSEIDVVPFYSFNDGSFCHNPPSTHIVGKYTRTGKFGKLGTPAQYLKLAKEHGVENPLVLFCRDVTHYHFTDADARRVRGAPLVAWTTLGEQCRRAKKGPKVFLEADDIKPVARFGWLGDRVRKAARKAVRALYNAEFIDAIDVALGGGPSGAGLEAAWKKALIGDNHDALFYNHGPAFLVQDGTDAAALEIVESAAENAAGISARKLRGIGQRLQPPLGEGTRLVVFNTLPWACRRTAEATLRLPLGWDGAAVFEGSNQLPAEVASVDEAEGDEGKKLKITFPCEFDGAGYKCYYLRQGASKKAEALSSSWELESEAFAIELDPKAGAIARLRDKVSGLECQGPLNHYKAYFGELGCWSKVENVRLVSKRRSAFGVEAELEGDLAGTSAHRPPLGDREAFAHKHPKECPFLDPVKIVVPFRLRIALDDVARAIRFEVTFDFPMGTQIGQSFGGTDISNVKAQIQRGKYALRALFRVPAERSVWADVPFGAAPRKLPVFPGVNWCRAEFDGKAMTLINDGTLGYTNDEDGIGNMLAMASSGVHGSSTKDRYLYAYLSGKHTFRYWLVMDQCALGPDALTRKALELTTPLVVGRAGSSKGSLPEAQTFLRLSEGLVPTCVREREGIEIRLYEGSGCKRHAEVALHESLAGTAYLTRLDGRNKGRIGDAGERVQIGLKPWQIATLAIRR